MAIVKFSVSLAVLPHQSTNRFESNREFCVWSMFPTNANFTSRIARRISIAVRVL